MWCYTTIAISEVKGDTEKIGLDKMQAELDIHITSETTFGIFSMKRTDDYVEVYRSKLSALPKYFTEKGLFRKLLSHFSW